MLVTLDGIVTDVMPEFPVNAAPPILVTVFGMVIEVTPGKLYIPFGPMAVTVLPLSELGTVTAPVGLVLEVVVTPLIVALPLLAE